MDTRLTPEEIKLASKYINKYERDYKSVKYGRWVTLFISFALIISSYYLILQCQKIGQMNTAEYLSKNKEIDLNILDKYIDARLEGKKIKTDVLSKYIDARKNRFGGSSCFVQNKIESSSGLLLWTTETLARSAAYAHRLTA